MVTRIVRDKTICNTKKVSYICLRIQYKDKTSRAHMETVAWGPRSVTTRTIKTHGEGQHTISPVHQYSCSQYAAKPAQPPASTTKTVYPTEWTIAWTVETRATQRWKLLYVPKSHPVSHMSKLFLMPNSQIKGKLAKDMMPVRSET